MNSSHILRPVLRCLIAATFGILLAGTQAQAPHFTTLYQFTNGTDGESPIGGVIQDSAGLLYGTTSFGGDPGCHIACSDFGTLFSFSPTTGLRTFIHFASLTGTYPMNTLLLHGSTLMEIPGIM